MKAKKLSQSDIGTMKRLLPFIGRRWIALLASLILAAGSVILQLYVPILFGDAIDTIAAAGQVDYAAMWGYLRQVLICAGAAGLCTWGMGLLNNRMTYRIVQDIRSRAIRHIQHLPLSYLDGHSSGDIVSRVIADTDVLSDGLLLGFTQLFSGILTVAVTLVFMFSKNVPVSLLVVLLTPLSFLVARFLSSRSFRLFRQQSEIRGRQTALIDEMIGGQKVVKAFGYEKRASERFAEINDELVKCSQQAVFYSSLTNPSTRFVNSVIYAGVALVGVLLIPGGSLTVGGLSVLLAYANQYMKPFNDISSVVTEFQNALACAARLFELIDTEPESSDDGKDELTNPNGSVSFNGVAFSYDKNKQLIKDFNFHADAGKKIAVVGPTGCGKTTLINLLLRFYDVDSGSITVDGININDITRESLRTHFGMVLQDTWIKNATVKENIAFGKADAADEEIIEAAKAARAHGFIKRLKNGYDTVIGDGDGLSEGERQLLCIARVMLLKPPMLILDEATSSIDTLTEIRVQEAFTRLMENRTSFVVAHRLSTVRDADCILVMKDGRVAEHGTHGELLKLNGFYAKLYNSQFSS